MLDHFGLLSTYLSVIKASHVQPISPFENRVHLDICQSPRSVTNHLAQTWMSTSPGKCEVKSTMGFGGTYFFPNKPHQAPEHEENRKHCQRHLMLRPALRHQESLWLFSMAWVSEAFFWILIFYHIELISPVSLSMRWDDLLIDVGFA